MIKAFRTVQKQLVFAQRARFCQTPNSNNSNQGQGNNSSQEQQAAQPQAEKTHQAQQTHQPKEAQKDQKKQYHNQNQEQRDAKQNAQQTGSTSVYGSKITAGNSEEIKKSIQKSVGDFANTYKLNLNDKKQKVGNKLSLTKSENQESISQKKEKLLKNIKLTEEQLTDKHIGNVPIAQQIMVDRLKKYALRISDNKRIREHLDSEEGVDFSYVEPRNLEILNSHIHRRSEEMEEMIANYLGVNQILNRDEQLEEWRQQQAMDSINFTPETMGKPEAFYPGSEKGPHPFDDPLNYLQWYEKHCPTPYRPLVEQMIQVAEMKVTDNNMPSYIKKWIKQVQEDPQDILKEKEEEEDDLDSDEDADVSEEEDVGLSENRAHNDELEQQLAAVVGGGQGVFFYKSGPLPRLNADNTSLWQLDQKDELPEDTSPEEQIINCEGNITFHSGLQDYEIPPFPEAMTAYVTHYQIPIIDKWSVFRQFPNMYHWWKKFYETTKEYSEQPLLRYQYTGLPSLYTYFYTMPEFARNNLIVQNVARCFEFNRHELSHTQKQMALNFAAKFSLPIDDMVAYAATQMIVSQKHFLTAKEEDRLRTVNQFYYEADPEAWEIHLAHEEHTIEQIENFQAPKHLGVEEVEEQLCDLPLEYYDNDDGFWNDFIKEKLNRNNSAYPTTQSRAFFKH